MPGILECTGLHKSFDSCHALRGVDLATERGQIVALLGPSGCGKTTLLRLIAGFEWPDAGAIIVNGRAVAGNGQRVPAEHRRVGMVFQDYALFPHLDVAGNIAFGLRGPAQDRQARVTELLDIVGLPGLGDRPPHALSGGQQQRVALARALAPRPDVLLLDEPFSNLDAALRAQVRHEVRAILKRAGTTCVFVTHDREEALSLADSIAVMFEGRIAQMAAPEVLYHHPTSPEVAAFVGEANFLHAVREGLYARCALGVLPLEQTPLAEHEGVLLMIRPEALRLHLDADGNGHVAWREFYGPDQRVGVVLEGGEQLVARPGTHTQYAPGQRVAVRLEGPVRAYHTREVAPLRA
mgnify:FL=1